VRCELSFLPPAGQRLRRRAEWENARGQILCLDALTAKERSRFERVSLEVSGRDAMFVKGGYRPAEHYLRVGLSAMRCIDSVLDRAPKSLRVTSILDFACGYGRILRFLRPSFPDARITASDLDKNAAVFCARTFQAETFLSKKDFTRFSLPGSYDLIWCGSLLSHLDESAAAALLEKFSDVLQTGGLCVFSSHGLSSFQKLTMGEDTFNLAPEARRKVSAVFGVKGYAYADYRRMRGYGVSWVLPERMISIAQSAGAWRPVCVLEKAWDGNQDIYGFIKN